MKQYKNRISILKFGIYLLVNDAEFNIVDNNI